MTASGLPPDLRKELRQKQLVFTISTGRSGTRYLAFLLSGLPDTKSVHEPDPNFASVMRKVQTHPEDASVFWREQKLPAIADAEASIYIETSHLFCKGFFGPLLKLRLQPALIFLRRNHREVALSLYRLGTIPGRGEKALRYYLSPEDPSTHAPDEWTSFHDYQLCYWYALEIERRDRIYRKVACDHGLNAAVLRFSELVRNDVDSLTNTLGLPRLPKIEKVKCSIGKYIRRTRSLNEKNKKRESPKKIDEMESIVEYHFAKKKEIETPNLEESI